METIDLADGGFLLLDRDFLPADDADRCFAAIRREATWEQKAGVFGRPQPRLTASQGDPGVVYRYSGTTNPALSWTPTVLALRERIEAVRGSYNYCLLNFYRDGRDSVGWHSDDEPGLGPTIASLSLGAGRTFRLRHNESRETRSFELGRGSLLVMDGATQRFWKHEVPKTDADVGERINLTFRRLDRA